MTREDAWRALLACYAAERATFVRNKAMYEAQGGHGTLAEPPKSVTDATLLTIAFELREIAELLRPGADDAGRR